MPSRSAKTLKCNTVISFCWRHWSNMFRIFRSFKMNLPNLEIPDIPQIPTPASCSPTLFRHLDKPKSAIFTSCLSQGEILSCSCYWHLGAWDAKNVNEWAWSISLCRRSFLHPIQPHIIWRKSCCPTSAVKRMRCFSLSVRAQYRWLNHGWRRVRHCSNGTTQLTKLLRYRWIGSIRSYSTMPQCLFTLSDFVLCLSTTNTTCRHNPSENKSWECVRASHGLSSKIWILHVPNWDVMTKLKDSCHKMHQRTWVGHGSWKDPWAKCSTANAWCCTTMELAHQMELDLWHHISSQGKEGSCRLAQAGWGSVCPFGHTDEHYHSAFQPQNSKPGWCVSELESMA